MAPMRRKSHGSIRSPHVKRDSQSQVIIEGWLYKLEGAAIKQFKHRWCVLADFCLFFYKGPSEDKTTSSILLPSYKISPCTTEDKVSRKFSFKAEHQNMKTYYFAADDKETMQKWMNAMSLASIMQNFVRSDNYEATFSSASNDDEESGFTSYRSRRYTSQKLNTNYDSNFSSEPLKQRSNSYGDRMGEVYLGSDDKYPNVYKSTTASHLYKTTPQHSEVPRRQPLYANAPPKPRRLTQSDSYNIYPQDGYDPRDAEIPATEQSQYYDNSGEAFYTDHQNVMGYHPYDKNAHYFPGSDPVLMNTQMHYMEGYSPKMYVESVPDIYKSQPPRPRSADFLEREGDGSVMPDIAQYPENRQPQRPKSSMEYYDRYADSEDCNFDYYREAVRIQADNLYSNKNSLKTRKHHTPRQQQMENPAYNDPGVDYARNKSYLTNEQMSPCYGSTTKGTIRYDESANSNSPYPQREYYDNQNRSSKPKSQESMQRLLEWKQRMLQSPLTRRNQIQSNSSDTSSPMNSPLRISSYKNESRQSTRKEPEARPQHARQQDDYNYPALSPKYPQNYADQRQRNNSCSSQPQFDAHSAPAYAKQENTNTNSKFAEPHQKRNLNASAENLYKENVMYCVDSENNEILFSYDDNSPTSGIPRTLQTCHYPPQMHSFTTMPNVSNIGSNNNISKYDGQEASDLSYKKGKHTRNVRDSKESTPSGPKRHQVTYSSDDEASIDSDSRNHNIYRIKHTDLMRSVSAEMNAKEPNQVQKLVQHSEGLMYKGKRLSVSAGDLLGKTHEELVLLLIQLRRNQAKILRSREKLERQIENFQEYTQSSTSMHRSYQNIKDLQKQIQLLEKQHEVTQPLVSLVDNMVKLGSLYGSSNRRSFSLPLLDASQEDVSAPSEGLQSPDYTCEPSILSKLLAEESTFQKRISEIYSLDKGLRYETNSISSMQEDKKMLEDTLSGMRNKILDHQDRPSELQKLKKQQKMIEKELVRVKRFLSSSAKKIEDAASKNDQMEKDILYLRQILKEALKMGSTEMNASQHNRADIEAELSRVQNVLDELANHRHEINNTVLKLKGEATPAPSPNVPDVRASPLGISDSKDDAYMKVIRKGTDTRISPIVVSEAKEDSYLKKVKKGVEVRASPTGVAGSAPLPVRKKQHSMYLETDLDTMVTRDLAVIHEKDLDDIPVYVNAEEINNPSEEIYENLCNFENEIASTYNTQSDASIPDQCSMQDINDADDRMKRFYGIIPKEKPSEIKTVRIVKRQSERRNRGRDKKRVTYDDNSSVWVMDEPDISSDDLLDMDEGNIPDPPMPTRPSSIQLFTSNRNRPSSSQSAHERLFGTAIRKDNPMPSASQERTTSKRSKRRHYTVSGYQYVLDPQFAQYFKDRPRSRDDVDMERCLRTANTPDIVRSTIKKKEVFDDKIIERELMLPQKIEIPERYVEVEPEQLSASEKLQRSLKAENICKMLSETTTTYEDIGVERSKSPEALHKKLSEEKQKRAHLLNLNRAIAREVVEKSKAVAANVCSADNQTSS